MLSCAVVGDLLHPAANLQQNHVQVVVSNMRAGGTPVRGELVASSHLRKYDMITAIS